MRHTPSEPMDWERPSERFLAYLERLSAACIARDRDEVDKLMRMRLLSHVPRAVLDELEFFRRARESNLRAPLRLMRYVHKIKQLATVAAEKTQLPLELRERDVSAPVASTRRRAARKSDVEPTE
ncbi:MAG: hypothetical protein WD825_12595 [Gemmatimonadaceae bacterium]